MRIAYFTGYPILPAVFWTIAVINVMRQYPEIEAASKKNLELIVAKQEKQIQFFRILTAKGRYEFLEKNYPELLQRVSISQLAS